MSQHEWGPPYWSLLTTHASVLRSPCAPDDQESWRTLHTAGGGGGTGPLNHRWRGWAAMLRPVACLGMAVGGAPVPRTRWEAFLCLKTKWSLGCRPVGRAAPPVTELQSASPSRGVRPVPTSRPQGRQSPGRCSQQSLLLILLLHCARTEGG